jgi:hypothetical protein
MYYWQCNLCNAIVAMQSLQCNLRNAIFAMQSLQCHLRNAIFAIAYIHIYIYIFIYVYIYIHNMYIHRFIYIYIYIYIHTARMATRNVERVNGDAECDNGALLTNVSWSPRESLCVWIFLGRSKTF